MALNDYSVGIDVTDHGVATGNSAATNQTALLTLLDGPYISKIRDDFGSLPDIIFPAADDDYNFTGEIDVYGTVRIRGGAVSGKLGISSVTLKFASGDYAFRFMSSEVGDPLPGAFWAEVRDMWLQPLTTGSVDFGIIHHTPMRFENVTCDKFNKGGFFAAGSTSGTIGAIPSQDETGGVCAASGNTNGSVYMSCAAKNTVAGHGFIASGNEAGITDYISCDARLNNGCGFYDNTTVGCRYLFPHTAQNSWKVSHGGLYYACVYPHTSASTDEPGVGVNWRTYWVPVTATVADQAWALTTFFRATGGVNYIDETGDNFCLFGGYTEGGIEVGFVPRGTGEASGGNYWSGRAYVDGPDAVQFRSPQSIPAWAYDDGAGNEFGASLGTVRNSSKAFATGHTDDTDVSTPGQRGIELTYSTVRHAYEWNKGASTRFMSVTADGWSSSQGYSGRANVVFEDGFLLSGPGSREMRVRNAQSVTTIPNGTVCVAGEVFFFDTARNPGDVAAAMVTTGGTVGSGGGTEPVLRPFGVLEA